MRKVKLFIATSLDGYIANTNGSIDFLNSVIETTPDTTYETFIKTIDTVILGRTTYAQVINELSPDSYPYAEMKTFVLSTQNNLPIKENVTILNQSVIDLITTLKQQNGKDIWIVGGASIINPLIQENLIDEYYISIIPYLLGQGIPLFTEKQQEITLDLQSCKVVNGIIHSHYAIKQV